MLKITDITPEETFDPSRLGRFTIPDMYFTKPDSCKKIAELMAGMVVLEATRHFHGNTFGSNVEYLVICQAFSPVTKGGLISDYEATVDVVNGEIVDIRWKNLTTERLAERLAGEPVFPSPEGYKAKQTATGMAAMMATTQDRVNAVTKEMTNKMFTQELARQMPNYSEISGANIAAGAVSAAQAGLISTAEAKQIITKATS